MALHGGSSSSPPPPLSLAFPFKFLPRLAWHFPSTIEGNIILDDALGLTGMEHATFQMSHAPLCIFSLDGI